MVSVSVAKKYYSTANFIKISGNPIREWKRFHSQWNNNEIATGLINKMSSKRIAVFSLISVLMSTKSSKFWHCRRLQTESLTK